MDVVGARFQSDASDCAGLPAELGPRIDLRIELLNRIYRYKGGGITDDSGSVGDAQAHEGFVVGNAVDDVAGVLGTNTVGALGPGSAARVDHGAGTERNKILVIAAVQWQIINNLVAYRAAESGGGGVHHRDFFGDSDRFGCRAGLEDGVDARVLANFYQDILALKNLETLEFGAHGISAGLKVQSNIGSI